MKSYSVHPVRSAVRSALLPPLLPLLLAGPAAALTPDLLMCELLAKPGLVPVTDASPEFSWGFRDARPGDVQTACRIQVATSTELFKTGRPDLWDSGKIGGGASLNVPYGGAALPAGREVCWRVKAWDAKGEEGPWSRPRSFLTAARLGEDRPLRYPPALRRVRPARVATNRAGRVFVDFGRASFGWAELLPPPEMERGGEFVLHFGEKADGGGVDRSPGGSVRYARAAGALTSPGVYRVPFLPDARNTSGAAVRLPGEIGTVMPFRYVEVEACPFPVTAASIRQIAVTYPFDPGESAFVSSDPALDRVYRFCKYSIRMTSFAGVYVDGDRERIPYEADAYINQLGHYAADREFTLARYSHEYLMAHPTWPTEWKQHSIMMAWQDWMHTGSTESLERNYQKLKDQKLLSFCEREKDGLLETAGGLPKKMKDGSADIVDWPGCERDGFDFRPVNAVVNAFHLLNLRQMAEIAAALGKDADAEAFRARERKAREAFQAVFFDSARGRYVDGEGSAHASLHANMLPLAFGLAPEAERGRVADFVAGRGMACSVYGAQYLLEALFEAGRDDDAIALMTATGKRGWLNMMRAGSTVAMEAWDVAVKPNLDWNHAWGAAPANIIPRYVLGVRPLEPGFGKMLIRPQTGRLAAAEGYVPTVRGRVSVSVRRKAGVSYRLAFTLPANTSARVEVPELPGTELLLDGRAAGFATVGGRRVLDGVPSGPHLLTQAAPRPWWRLW